MTLFRSNLKVCRCCRRLFATAVSEPKWNKEKWEPIIGLEIHAQIASKSKLFSGASTEARQPVNTSVSYFDAALPGTLPVLNKKCVEAGVLTSLALNCKINLVSKFDRKHYFYFDLPAGYQITQNFQPLAKDGYIDYYVFGKGVDPYPKRTKIIQIQLEQDSGKSIYESWDNQVLIDLNRAGIGLMEIITEANIHSGQEAHCLVQELQILLRNLKTCDGQMELGHMRVDANVSVHRPKEPWGTRTEVKNINSMRYVQRAIDFEIERQIRELEKGLQIVNETMHYDPKADETFPLRDKESLHDYRYLPEPNLPPLRLFDDSHQPPKGLDPSQMINVDRFKENFPLPMAKKAKKFIDAGADPLAVLELCYLPVYRADFFTLINQYGCDPKFAAEILWNVYNRLLIDEGIKTEKSPVKLRDIAFIIDSYARREVTKQAAKITLSELAKGQRRTATESFNAHKWRVIAENTEIEYQCAEVLKENPELIDAYKRRLPNPKNARRIVVGLCNRLDKKTNFAIDSEIAENCFTKLLKAKF